MGANEHEERITDMTNLGPKMAEKLSAVGIGTPAQLREVGSVEAAIRIALTRPPDAPCRSALSALEGAVRGVRWHTIPKPEREVLWKRYRAAVDAQSA